MRLVVRLAGALCASVICAAAARAESVPASFDCKKAQRPVDRFICAHAVLRWQDLALSRGYRAVRNRLSGRARDDLLDGQRAWLASRDRACVGDVSFDTLAGEAGAQALQCLQSAYLLRRLALQNIIHPITASDVQEIDLGPIRRARPELVTDGNVTIADVKISPDGMALALLLPSLDFDFPDQAWLYSVATRDLRAATPPPFRGEAPAPPRSPAAITQVAWQDGVLYSRVALWNTEGDGEEGQTTIYAATQEGYQDIGQVEGDLYMRLSEGDLRGVTVDQADVPEDQWDMLGQIHGNDQFLVWHDDLGHGTVALTSRARTDGAPDYLVAWGGWELANHLLDATRPLLTYPADIGIVLFDMDRVSERRVTGTSPEDRPLALSIDTGRFVWATHARCGQESLARVYDSAPGRLCIARISLSMP